MRETSMKALCSAIAAFAALTQFACENGGRGGGLTGSTSLESTPPASIVTNIAGTWRGGDDSVHLVWSLAQDGDTVNGASQVASRDGWTGGGGRVVGTIAGSMLSFDETHAVGTLTVDGCAVHLEGTLRLDTIVTPVSPPKRYYSGGPPFPNPEQTIRERMSGFVRGQGCGGAYAGTVSLLRD
jgi:hypothetical protein